MPYRIAGIDVHKRMLAVVVSDVEVRRRVQLRAAAVWQQSRTTAICWPLGCSSKRSRKWSWNRRRSTGNRCGELWNGIGSRCARSGKAPVRTSGTLHLAQAQSNRGPRGRKR